MDVQTEGEFLLASQDLRDDLPFFQQKLGFRLEQIYPADNPSVALLSGHGLRVRLEVGADHPPVTLRILTDEPDSFSDGELDLLAPNGTRIQIAPRHPPLNIPDTQHDFLVKRLQDRDPWVIGRAGMQYRDLIPSRLGGSIIASHIRIPDGGPVPDMVHYHSVGFQLIYCYRGWVDLVYEDQGPQFRLHAGDCLIQPPEIRHRVLYASDHIEVIEIAVPAEHLTTIDHEMELPNPTIDRARLFQGQRFVLFRNGDAAWDPFRIPGFVACDTGIADGSGGTAHVTIARYVDHDPPMTDHNADILFNFVLEGTMQLSTSNLPPVQLEAGDAFVIPPGLPTQYSNCSEDLQLLEVSLPGRFRTIVSD